MTSWLDDLFGSAGAPTDAAYITVGAPPVALTGARALGVSAGQVAGSDGGAGSSYTLGLAASGATPGAYTAANITVDTYGRVTSVASGESRRWNLVAPANYTAEPPATNTITMAGVAMLEVIRPGCAIKWLCATPNATGVAPLGGATAEITGEAITGIAETNVSVQGLIWVDIIADGGAMFTFKLYNNPGLQAADMIAHTASFDHTGSAARALIEDNSSGIGGTLTNGAGALSAKLIAMAAEWCGIVESVTNVGAVVYVTIVGRPLITLSSSIGALWWGPPEMVQHERVTVTTATPAGAAIDDVLATEGFAPFDNQYGAYGMICQFGVQALSHGGGTAKLNMMNASNEVSSADGNNGYTIAASGTWYRSGVDLNVNALFMGLGNGLELSCKATDGALTLPTLEYYWVWL